MLNPDLVVGAFIGVASLSTALLLTTIIAQHLVARGEKEAAILDAVERLADGRAIARTYRQDFDGYFREVHRAQIKAGDRVIVVGINGDRLFRCASVKAVEDATNVGVQSADEYRDLLREPS